MNGGSTHCAGAVSPLPRLPRCDVTTHTPHVYEWTLGRAAAQLILSLADSEGYLLQQCLNGNLSHCLQTPRDETRSADHSDTSRHRHF